MPEGLTVTILIVLLLILWAEFVNGWTDAPNAIATVVATRVLAPMHAVGLAVVLNIAGALSGTAVAATIGKDIIRPEVVTPGLIGAAMVGIIIWSTLAWRFGLPTSESHALVSGLAGAALATAGPDGLVAVGWSKVALGLVFSVIFGFGVAFVLMVLIYNVFHKVPRGTVSNVFSRAQVFSAGFMAFSHGSNDAQKFMGAFALTLLTGGVIEEFYVPIWVILLCAGIMGLGTASGGWRIIHTLGTKVTKLEPVHGFAAETGAASIIELASRLGIPLSTTQTIATAIIGVGATRRLSAVRWGVTGHIMGAWVLTFPICAAIAWLTASLARFLGLA